MQPPNKSAARPLSDESEEPPASSFVWTSPPSTSDASTRQLVRGNEPKLTPAQQRERQKDEAARLKEADGRRRNQQEKKHETKRLREEAEEEEAEEDQAQREGSLKLLKLVKISPTSVAYAGFGVLGTQGVMRVSTGEVDELLRKKGIEVDSETVRWLLDAGINGAQPEWLLASGGKAIGLCFALVKVHGRHALHLSWAKQKICATFSVGLQQAYAELMRLGPACAKQEDPKSFTLLQALGSVFVSEDNQCPLANLLSQLGLMLNHWSDRKDTRGGEKWDTTLIRLTTLLENAAQDIKAGLPTKDELLDLVAPETELMTDEARRVRSFILRDIGDGNGQLNTNLSSAFLKAQMPFLQANIFNHLDAEHGKDFRALTRVVLQLLSVETIMLEGRSVFVAQVLSPGVLKDLILDALPDYFFVEDSGNGIGWVWCPADVKGVRLGGVRLFKTGFFSTKFPDEEEPWEQPLNVPPIDGIVDVEQLFLDVSGARRFAIPSLLLRGFEDSPATFKELCQKAPRVLVITVPAEGFGSAQVLDPLLSQSSSSGRYLRRLLQPLWRHWRKVVVVCASPDWIAFWSHHLEQGGVKKKNIHHLTLVDSLDERDGFVPDTRFMLRLDSDEHKGRAIQIWFNMIARLCGGDLVNEDADVDGDELVCFFFFFFFFFTPCFCTLFFICDWSRVSRLKSCSLSLADLPSGRFFFFLFFFFFSFFFFFFFLFNQFIELL